MMPLQPFTASSLILNQDNIDTDQIIPARFLTTTKRAGLARAAFADWRFDQQGQPRPDCLLDDQSAARHPILIAGRNFGCGSSREHAVWALMEYGFRAVISPKLADIFRANALKNGLLAIDVDPAAHAWLVDHPGQAITVDVAERQLSLSDGGRIGFELDPFARTCLLEGTDALGYLLGRLDAITAFEAGLERAA